MMICNLQQFNDLRSDLGLTLFNEEQFSKIGEDCGNGFRLLGFQSNNIAHGPTGPKNEQNDDV